MQRHGELLHTGRDGSRRAAACLRLFVRQLARQCPLVSARLCLPLPAPLLACFGAARCAWNRLLLSITLAVVPCCTPQHYLVRQLPRRPAAWYRRLHHSFARMPMVNHRASSPGAAVPCNCCSLSSPFELELTDHALFAASPALAAGA